MPVPSLLNDARRLAELRGLAILDTPPEPDFNDLASLAAAVCRSPIAAINFVDDERHFTKAIVGLDGAANANVANEVSLCAATVSTADGVLVVEDTRADERFKENPLVTGEPAVGFYAGVSITSRGQRVGVLCAFGSEPREVSEAEYSGLTLLARQVEGQLELRRRNAELRHLSVTDPLTGLANRTLLLDRLELALAGRERSGQAVGLMFCDVDEFKAVNDRHGHDIGDRVLCDVADGLREAVRSVDTVARVAGDEFVVVCPDVAESALAVIVERIVRRQRPSLPDASPAPRLSIGAVIASKDDDAVSVLRRGDHAMYADKARR